MGFSSDCGNGHRSTFRRKGEGMFSISEIQNSLRDSGEAATPEDTNSFCALRDNAVERFLAENPATTKQLVQVKLFRREAKARERLNTLERQKRVQRSAKVMENGRPLILWSVHDVSKPQHEYELTKMVLCLDFAEKMTRVATACLADLQFWIRGEEYAGELDRNTMKPDEIRDRLAKYDGYDHDVIWVCPTRERVEELKTIARVFKTAFAFTTLAELQANARGYIFEGVTGEKSCLTT
jgi:hypothetical protein